MTLPNPLRVVFLLVLVCLIGSGFCPFVKAKGKSMAASHPSKNQTTSNDAAATQSPDEEKADGTAFGLFPMEDLHAIIREERKAALSDIDNERKATLEYLSAERRTTMVELEAMGNRMIQNAIIKSKTLIDHLILRILELALVMILLICIVGFVGYRLWRKEKKATDTTN